MAESFGTVNPPHAAGPQHLTHSFDASTGRAEPQVAATSAEHKRVYIAALIIERGQYIAGGDPERAKEVDAEIVRSEAVPDAEWDPPPPPNPGEPTSIAVRLF